MGIQYTNYDYSARHPLVLLRIIHPCSMKWHPATYDGIRKKHFVVTKVVEGEEEEVHIHSQINIFRYPSPYDSALLQLGEKGILKNAAERNLLQSPFFVVREPPPAFWSQILIRKIHIRILTNILKIYKTNYTHTRSQFYRSKVESSTLFTKYLQCVVNNKEKTRENLHILSFLTTFLLSKKKNHQLTYSTRMTHGGRDKKLKYIYVKQTLRREQVNKKIHIGIFRGAQTHFSFLPAVPPVWFSLSSFYSSAGAPLSPSTNPINFPPSSSLPGGLLIYTPVSRLYFLYALSLW